MSERDFSAVLKLRSKALKAVAAGTYESNLREVMWQTAFVMSEAAAEIDALRERVRQLEQANTLTN